MNKKNVAIITGGFSGEYDISLKTAQTIDEYINKNKYNSFIIKINPNKWVYTHNSNEFHINKNDFSLKLGNKKINFDIVFIALHGIPGENGIVQSYFDLLNIPYTSSSHSISSLTFNKWLCNSVLKQLGFNCAKSLLFRNKNINKKEIVNKLKIPCFVKPNNSGSSIGITKINEINELDYAIAKAFDESNEILVEECLEGREFTCGAFSYKGEITVLPVTEIISENDFFDYEAKYLGKSQEITPARLNEKNTKLIQSNTYKIMHLLDIKGVARIDYILKENILYVLEINTIPGMTKESIIPKQLKEYGLSIDKLIDLLLEDALWRKKSV